MKINKLTFALLAGAMAVSCSDDQIVDSPVNPGTEINGSGYISIAIGMPAELRSRANDSFDDGKEYEYNVNSLAIMFFTGEESTAEFYRAYNVTPAAFEVQNPAND